MKKINNLSGDKILKNLDWFNKSHEPFERYASFDYCFNYFQERYKNGEITKIASFENIQLSCLHLGFYLASWGMYRGSTFLLQKSVKIFEPLIKYITSKECDVWDIDVENYAKDNNIDKLIKCGERIEKELGIHKDKKATDTLVTKIMLGVFGNVPAFDNYFRLGSSLQSFNKNSLEEIYKFLDKNREIISTKAKGIKTLNYQDGSNEKIRTYTQAKIIDMIFFTEGIEIDPKNKHTTK